ncbi:MAG: winged helix-turn-helix transcriptional regulator [Thaumarchaeota archaeon]|nr:winged helix-turn-helix transcriptional regulator [Nitrososphaerota archaeon]
MLKSSSEADSVAKSKTDPNTRRLISYLFTGTRGGANRLRIILLLAERPLNLHQISKELGLDYNAIQFHIEVLEKNNLVSRVGERYGALFFLSTFLEHNIEAFNEIIVKLYKSLNMKSFEETN